jgi:hypothetical protein
MHDIDHFMIAANDLERLSQQFTDMTGVPVAQGGSHPDLGTHNALVATTSEMYLELIAPNPALEARSDLREAIEQIEVPQLHRIIVLGNLDQFPRIVEAYRRVGVGAVVRPLSRRSATGEVLRWHLLMPAGRNELGVFAPLFIDWGTATHPSRTLPAAPCTVMGCRAVHPDADKIAALWKEIGFDLPVTQAPQACITLTLDTPQGLVEFMSAS